MLNRKHTKAEAAAWERLKRAANDFEQIRSEYEQASSERDAALRDAHRAGLTRAEMADALAVDGQGPLTKQRLHVLLQRALAVKDATPAKVVKQATSVKKATPVKKAAEPTKPTPRKRGNFSRSAVIVDPTEKYRAGGTS